MVRQTYEQSKEEFKGGKSLTEKLKEMGFNEKSFVSVDVGFSPVEVSYGKDEHGQPIIDQYASFGGNHVHPSDPTHNQDKYRLDAEMAGMGPEGAGKFPFGVCGGNNGVYAAKLHGSSEMIITKDPEIYHALRDQLNMPDGMGVPLSNGGINNVTRYINYKGNKTSFKEMNEYCDAKNQRRYEEQRKKDEMADKLASLRSTKTSEVKPVKQTTLPNSNAIINGGRV